MNNANEANEAKRFNREMNRRFTDVLAKPASDWLRIQRANPLACWPLSPRTRAWGRL